MNLFNRIFSIVSLLVLTVLVLGVLLIPPEQLSALTASLFAMVNNVQPALRALISLLLIVIVILLLWLEFRRPGSRTVEVARSTGGRIRITTGHVEDRVAEQIDAMSGVIQSKVRISERDNSVIARVDVVAAPNLDLVTKGEDIAAKTREVIQDQLGLKLSGKPQITIKTSKMKPIAATPSSPTPSTGSTTGDKA
jgi:hypothetical protein